MEDRFIFLAGFAVGALVSTIFGWMTNKTRAARKQAGARHQPQSVSQKTSKTPAQVVRESIQAFFTWLLWLLFVVGFLAALGYGMYLLFTL